MGFGIWFGISDMILCAIDDLMFSVKISTAAKALGAEIYFERKPDQVVPRIRERRPDLVIFDLNNPRTDPLGTVAAMKADPALGAIPTIGFVSHVHTELINQARQAGVADVMARSLFAEKLPEILSRGL